MATTVCPVRLLDAEAAAVAEWVMAVGEYEPMTGQIIGVKEWPGGGRLIDQPAAVADAVYIVLGELQEMRRPQGKEGSGGTAAGTGNPPSREERDGRGVQGAVAGDPAGPG